MDPPRPGQNPRAMYPDDKPFNYGDFFGGLIKTGAELGKAALIKTPTVKPSPQQVTQPPAAQPGWMKWAIIGGIGVGVLLVAGLAFKK